MKKNIRLIIAIVAGVIAVFLVMSYMKQQEQVIAQRLMVQTKTARKPATVVIAKRTISEGTALSERDLQLKEVPEDAIQPRAASSIERVVGRITTVPIEQGEQILMTKLSVPESATSLSMKTPPGKRAITIPIDNITGLSGMLRPGDKVDIMTTMKIPAQDIQGKVVEQPMVIPLFQNVLVLAVGSDIGGVAKEARTERTASTITFAITPQESTLLAYVQEQAKLRLTLRSPADNTTQPMPPASPQALFQYISSQLPQQPQQPKEEIKPTKVSKVEVYRGTEKQTVTLGE